MQAKSVSVTLNRVAGDAKQIRAQVFTNGKYFPVILSIASGEAFVTPLKIWRAYKAAFPKSRISMGNKLFKHVAREIATDWRARYRRVEIRTGGL